MTLLRKPGWQMSDERPQSHGHREGGGISNDKPWVVHPVGFRLGRRVLALPCQTVVRRSEK